MKQNEFNPVFKSCLGDKLQAFLVSKRAIGYRYESEARMLVRLDDYFFEKNISEVTDQSILAWVEKRETESDKTHGIRVSILHQFCLFLGRDGVVVPLPQTPKGAGFSKSFTPYIFTTTQIQKILRSADTMPKRRNSKNITAVMPVLLRLLYCCGLRINEALSLHIENLDFRNGTLTILHGKNDNCRIVPMTDSLCVILEKYLQDMYAAARAEDFLFPTAKMEQYSSRTIYSAFREILWCSGISHGGRGKGPRLHDMRHTFAVHSLQKLIIEGKDTYLLLPILSTYLGHKNIYATERYLRLTSEMYPDILEKVEASTGRLIPAVIHYEVD